MKKIIGTLILIIIIPYLVVTLFIKDDNIKYKFNNNIFVRILDEETNVLNKIPLEEYVKGVVAGEMPVSFNIEALKAQAVASRSYVLKKMQENINNNYDVVTSTKNQVYLTDEKLKNSWNDKYDEYNNKIKQAILETKGEYISYNNQVIDALFFSTSNGKTENSEDVFINEVPYLRSVDSLWDNISPVFNSQKEISLYDFYTILNLKYSSNLNIDIISTTQSGAVKNLKINDILFNATTVRDKLGLKSTSFEIKQNENEVIINVKGYGHGVGMSQYGAEGMAQNGYLYKDIINHYYKDVEIKKI